jgi:hypothetical protein
VRLVVLLAAPASVPVAPNEIEPVEIIMSEPPAAAAAPAPMAAGPAAPRTARARSKDPDDPDRLEWSVLPATAYDIDIGLGFGALVTLAKFEPGYAPYRWRLEILANATVKRVAGVGVTFPVQDDFVRADVPGLWNGRLRIHTQLRFRRFANQGWFGLGNAAPRLTPWAGIDPERDPDAFAAARRYHQYDRIYPQLDFNTRIIVWDAPVAGPPLARSRRRPGLVPAHKRRLEILLGASFAYNIIRPYPGSKLAEDLRVRETDTADGETLRELVHGVDNHAVATLNLGLIYDTRDHEFVPTRGSFTELSTRLSPGVDDGLAFAQVFISTAHFQPLAGEYLVLASRVAFDWLFGRPPLYELAQFGVLVQRDGPGGSWSIRGVPRQRYFGKQKAIANLELRSMFYRFEIRSQRFGIGALAFVDAGRVWTDYRPVTLAGVDVDGNFADLEVGLGAGLRLTWGETMVVRIDPAWSPTERNFGLYLDIGQMF